MKTKILMAAVMLALGAGGNVRAVPFTYNSGFGNGGTVPDGSTSGWSDTRTVGGLSGPITGLRVRLDLSGGYNGDLYCYLSYNGVLVPLLNRVGVGTGNAFGDGDAGLNVTFTDSAANNIHSYQTVSGYSIAGGAAWQPDGRTLDPVTSAPSAFDAPGTISLASYLGMDPGGDWSLFVADVSGSGGQSTVQSWGLDITTGSVALVPAAGPGLLVTGMTLAALLTIGWVRRRAVANS